MNGKNEKYRENHGLAAGVVYGPVASRRFGLTLGVNLLPAARKLCSFNCAYCQLGWSRSKPSTEGRFPSVGDLKRALEDWLATRPEATDPAHLVVSGNGEPTLHPDFPDAAATIVAFRDASLPKTRLVVFTCGSETGNPRVLDALRRFDECHVKIDADCDRVDLPPKDFNLDMLIRDAATLSNLVVQSCFVTGVIDNTDDASVARWAETVARTRTRRADIYTIEREPAAKGLRPVPRARLEEIAATLKRHGVPQARVVSS